MNRDLCVANTSSRLEVALVYMCRKICQKFRFPLREALG